MTYQGDWLRRMRAEMRESMEEVKPVVVRFAATDDPATARPSVPVPQVANFLPSPILLPLGADVFSTNAYAR